MRCIVGKSSPVQSGPVQTLRHWVWSQHSSWRLQRIWWCESQALWTWSPATGTQVTTPYWVYWSTCTLTHRKHSHQNTPRIIFFSGDSTYLFRWLCLPVQVTLLLPGSLDVLLCISLKVLAAGFGEQMYFLCKASKRPPAIVEVAFIWSQVGSGLGPPLVGEPAAVIFVVTCTHRQKRPNPYLRSDHTRHLDR